MTVTNVRTDAAVQAEVAPAPLSFPEPWILPVLQRLSTQHEYSPSNPVDSSPNRSQANSLPAFSSSQSAIHPLSYEVVSLSPAKDTVENSVCNDKSVVAVQFTIIHVYRY